MAGPVMPMVSAGPQGFQGLIGQTDPAGPQKSGHPWPHGSFKFYESAKFKCFGSYKSFKSNKPGPVWADGLDTDKDESAPEV